MKMALCFMVLKNSNQNLNLIFILSLLNLVVSTANITQELSKIVANLIKKKQLSENMSNKNDLFKR